MTAAHVHGLAGPVIRRLPIALAELLAVDLGGRAACVGLGPLFDEQGPTEPAAAAAARHHHAISTPSTT